MESLKSESVLSSKAAVTLPGMGNEPDHSCEGQEKGQPANPKGHSAFPI